jgi:phospholipid/cholesterol/gamma-HCH transport system permease protein
MKKPTPEFIKFDSEQNQLLCHGDWTLPNIALLQATLKKISLPAKKPITINGSDITSFDSAGAWLLTKWLDERDIKSKRVDFSEAHQQLIKIVAAQQVSESDIPTVKIPNWFARVGKLTMEQLEEFKEYLGFIGKLTVEGFQSLRPGHFRWRELAGIVVKTGYMALPIIALLSFMIGVVIAYQMGIQLKSYGANIFIVDFLGLAILREFGPLITAIMVAGRTGSAFTAELGTMKINQEIDALDTMGVTPTELLLLPRILGLLIALPLLALWADIFGVLGGMMMAKTMLSISVHDFLLRFQHAVPLRALIIGIGKAPVFALLIGTIGCFQGMQVEMSSDSVGKKTTRSVVLAIFFIIIADALFSIILSRLRL